jgi:hypothetical protein
MVMLVGVQSNQFPRLSTLPRPCVIEASWLEISLKTNAAKPKDEITLRQGVRAVKEIGMSEVARGAM